MIDSPLLETLKKLTETELQQLDKFVHSRLFYHPDNTSGVLALFEELMKYAPVFADNQALDRLNIAKQLNKTPQYVLKTASNLHAVVRKFISWAFREETDDDFFEQLALLKFYCERGLNQRFESLYEKVERYLAGDGKVISQEWLYKRFKLNAQKFDWLANSKSTTDLNLRTTLDSFEAYSLLQKAQYTYAMLVRILNFPFDTEGYLFVLADIERFCLRHTPEKNGLLLTFYEAILLLIEREDADFDRFKAHLQANESLLSVFDYHSLHGLERQYLLAQYTSGRNECLPQLFKTYQSHLEKHLLESNGYLSPFAFTNIVRYGCRLGELNWVEQFLKDYQQKLGGTPHPQELYRLYFAYFLIHKGQLDKAEAHLSVDFEDPITKVDARCFELMIMYETKSNLIDYKIESFRKLVRNTTGLPDVRREGFHNFALAFRKMLNPDLKRNNKKIDKIIAEIKAAPTSESIWLTNCLEKLKTRR